jgi:hypothetical protein
VVKVGGEVIPGTRAALTLREAFYPPVEYIPRRDVDFGRAFGADGMRWWRSQPCLYMMSVIPLTVQVHAIAAGIERACTTTLRGAGEVHLVGTGSITRRDSMMTKFKLLSVAAILSAVIASPGVAQPAVQEPGMQAFYQSLGVGSHTSGTASAFAFVRGTGSYARAPSRHHARASARHYASAHKL